MLQQDRTIVIWNPSSGSAAKYVGMRMQFLDMSNVKLCETDSREAAIHKVAEVCNNGTNLVVAAGGDGTISSVIEGIMQSGKRSILGVLPLGSGNDLARSLNVPLNPEEALNVLHSGNVREMDAARFTASEQTRWYANMLTGGNTGNYLENITDEVKQRWGPFCYLRGVVELVQDLQVYQIEVTCDGGRPEVFDVLNVFVANGKMSGGGLDVSPEAELDDGMVDLVVVRDGDLGEIAGLTANYLITDYLQHALVEFRRARHIVIKSDPPLPLTADGDQVGNTPLSVEVQPLCLRVIAPTPDVQ